MAMPKIPALLLMVLLCSLLLCGCGGQPLSKREIVHAVIFAQQGEHYSVCLLLADQNAPEGESAFKTASAAAPTPAQALENAAKQPDIAVLLVTEKIAETYTEVLDSARAKGTPLLITVPSTGGGAAGKDRLTRYIREAIGVKI